MITPEEQKPKIWKNFIPKWWVGSDVVNGRGTNGGRRPWAQALKAHQHTL